MSLEAVGGFTTGFGCPKKEVMEPLALGFLAASERGTLLALRFRDMIVARMTMEKRDSLEGLEMVGRILGLWECEVQWSGVFYSEWRRRRRLELQLENLA